MSKLQSSHVLPAPSMTKQLEHELLPCNLLPFPMLPGKKLATDIVGTFHSAPPDCRFAITLVDYYTKWPEVAFTSDVTSATVVAFLSTVFSCEGNPLELVTDNGSSLVSAVCLTAGSGMLCTCHLHLSQPLLHAHSP